MAELTRRLSRVCLLAAVVASVAGCVGMPANGPAQVSTAGPATSAPAVNYIGPYPDGPAPGGDPTQIVAGFLLASASYPTYTTAEQYLVSWASRNWRPGWAVRVYSDNLKVPSGIPVATASPRTGTSQKVTITVSGTLQASFDGSGQYVSAQGSGQAPGSYQFTLVKVGGQWRITNPPDYRMLTASDFQLFYKAQDLYFFDPQDENLVPDSVFVPLGATVSQLLDNLVSALVAGPKTPWLQDAAYTELPVNTTVSSVTVAGSTATVNLGGAAVNATPRQRELFYAQLIWTLTAPAAQLPIQSVVLEINGRPQTPQTAPCGSAGAGQTLTGYECFDPYPSSSSSFYYIDDGQLWARCGSKALALKGQIGAVVPGIDHDGAFTSQRCGAARSVYENSTASPPPQSHSLPALSMAAVSPDGKYLAVTSAAGNAVYITSLTAGVASFPGKPRLTTSDVTALSWDGNDDLWVAAGGAVTVLPPGGGQVPVGVTGAVRDLSVAPDGVRIAFIAQTPGQASALYLAAIGGGQPGVGNLGGPFNHLQIKQAAVIGPDLTHPVSLAWYDADNLVVLDDAASGNTLHEVPVDGEPGQALPDTPPGITSITADGAANVLVAGLSGSGLAVSTSLEGPFYPLGDSGQNPAYPG